jgi:hypothetical protein
MVAASRPPDFYVIGESGRKCPAFLQGEYRHPDGRVWLVGFTLGNDGLPFLIDPGTWRLVTWAGTITGVEIEPAEPVTPVWEVMTDSLDENIDGRADPIDWPEYPDLLKEWD